MVGLDPDAGLIAACCRKRPDHQSGALDEPGAGLFPGCMHGYNNYCFGMVTCCHVGPKTNPVLRRAS